jgi:hypothetical protein
MLTTSVRRPCAVPPTTALLFSSGGRLGAIVEGHHGVDRPSKTRSRAAATQPPAPTRSDDEPRRARPEHGRPITARPAASAHPARLGTHTEQRSPDTPAEPGRRAASGRVPPTGRRGTPTSHGVGHPSARSRSPQQTPGSRDLTVAGPDRVEVAAVKRGGFGYPEPLGDGDDSRVRWCRAGSRPAPRPVGAGRLGHCGRTRGADPARVRQVRAGLGKRRSAEDAGDSD